MKNTAELLIMMRNLLFFALFEYVLFTEECVHISMVAFLSLVLVFFIPETIAMINYDQITKELDDLIDKKTQN